MSLGGRTLTAGQAPSTWGVRTLGGVPIPLHCTVLPLARAALKPRRDSLGLKLPRADRAPAHRSTLSASADRIRALGSEGVNE